MQEQIMDPDRWDRLQDLFHEAINLRGEEREHFLQRECAGDAEMHRRIDALLMAEESTFSGTLAQAIGAAADQLTGGLAPDAQVGSYRVVREVGRGGMGTVY